MIEPVPPKLKRFPAAKQRRMDDLLAKNNEGSISAPETRRLETLVREAEQLMVSNAERLAAFAREQEDESPKGSVPVTVWVKAERAEA